MPAFAVFALVGVIAGLWVPIFPSAAYWPVAMLLCVSLAWWFAGVRLAVAMLAFTLASLRGHWYLENGLPQLLVGKDILVEGVVADLPKVTEYSTSFLFRLAPGPTPAAFPQFLRLRIYASEPSPRAGERWRFKVRLKQPLSSANSGGAGYESWLLANNIHARGYVRDSVLNLRVAEAGRHTRILRIRSELRDTLERLLPDNPALPLLTGISIGARDGISPSSWRILRASGTGHLVAISGLHIGLIALASWWPGRLLGWFLHTLRLVANPLGVARICVLFAGCAYALLAGFSVPTVRASIMVAVVLSLATMQRQRLPRGVVATALLAVLAITPLSVLTAGFWLSFIAVTLLYTFFSDAGNPAVGPRGRLARIGIGVGVAVRRACQSQLLLSVGLALPSLLFFGQVSLISPLANLVAIPLFTFWILPATLVGVFLTTIHGGLASALLRLAAVGLNWLMEFLARLATLPVVTWQPGYIKWLLVVLLCGGVVVWLLPRPFPGRVAGLLVFWSLLNADTRPVSPRLQLRVLDVGQGLAVLVQTSNHNLLYDAGGSWQGGDAGNTIIVPELAATGVRALDVLMISHDDADHRGGAESILHELPVAKLLASGEQQYSAGPEVQKCRRGMRWEWDGVVFDILHPGAATGWSDNDASCVLRVRFGNSTALLPGDIEAQAEFELMRRFDLRNVDLLLGPHHGSRTSSGAAFVRKLAATYVIFSAGYFNRWGFPVPEVVRRWVGSKACVLTTADSGALDFAAAADGGFSLVAAARSSLARPWPLRSPDASHCINTIKGADGTV